MYDAPEPFLEPLGCSGQWKQSLSQLSWDLDHWLRQTAIRQWHKCVITKGGESFEEVKRVREKLSKKVSLEKWCFGGDGVKEVERERVFQPKGKVHLHKGPLIMESLSRERKHRVASTQEGRQAVVWYEAGQVSRARQPQSCKIQVPALPFATVCLEPNQTLWNSVSLTIIIVINTCLTGAVKYYTWIVNHSGSVIKQQNS